MLALSVIFVLIARPWTVPFSVGHWVLTKIMPELGQALFFKVLFDKVPMIIVFYSDLVLGSGSLTLNFFGCNVKDR